MLYRGSILVHTKTGSRVSCANDAALITSQIATLEINNTALFRPLCNSSLIAEANSLVGIVFLIF